MMGCNGSRRVCRDADGFSVRLKTTKVVENCWKSTLVTEIGRIKVPKKGNLRPLRLELSHTAFRFGAIGLTISDPFEYDRGFWARLQCPQVRLCTPRQSHLWSRHKLRDPW